MPQNAMIGCGSKGGSMALFFAEKGFHVTLSDASTDAMHTLVDQARNKAPATDSTNTRLQASLVLCCLFSTSSSGPLMLLYQTTNTSVEASTAPNF